MNYPKCLKCRHFAWWDGDYVCMSKLSMFPNTNRDIMFNDELVKSIKEQYNCQNFKKSSCMHNEIFKEEFNKWRELHNLEKQLEKHVK